MLADINSIMVVVKDFHYNKDYNAPLMNVPFLSVVKDFHYNKDYNTFLIIT